MEPVQTKFFEDIELNWYERFLVNVSAAVFVTDSEPS